MYFICQQRRKGWVIRFITYHPNNELVGGIVCFILHLQFVLCYLGVYEVVIGGSDNTKTWIRNSTYGVNEVIADTPDILSPNEYRSFWIKWANGLIEV